MNAYLTRSMDTHGGALRLNDPWQQILGFGNRDLSESFEPIKYLGWIQYAVRNLRVDGRAAFNLDVGKRLNRLPEAVIVEGVEPLLEFILIVKNQHAASVPDRLGAMQICLRIPRSPRPAEGARK